MEYLDLLMTQNRIRPINNKLEAILNMKPPTNTKQVRVFIGLVNYFRDIWASQSHLLQPLTSFTSYTVKFKWTVVEQISFGDIKRAVSYGTLLAYLDFNKKWIYILGLVSNKFPRFCKCLRFSKYGFATFSNYSGYKK